MATSSPIRGARGMVCPRLTWQCGVLCPDRLADFGQVAVWIVQVVADLTIKVLGTPRCAGQAW